MAGIVGIILPLYALILIGFAAMRGGYLAPAHLAGVNALVMRVFLPAMIFLAIAGRPVAESLLPGAVLAYAAAGLAVLGLAFALARLAGQNWPRAAIEGMGASCPNSGFFGLPMITLVLGGDVATRAFAHAVLVENMIVIPAAIALCDRGAANGPRGLWRFAGGLARNPLLIAVAAGLVWAATGWPLPELVRRVLAMMNPVAAPVALIAIGGALAGLSLSGEVAGAGRVILAKLVVHPLLTLAAVMLFAPGLDGPMRLALVLYAAAPMMTIYTIFGARYGAEGLAVTAMLGAITASILTVPALIRLLAP